MRRRGIVAVFSLLAMVVSAQQPVQTSKFHDEESANVLKELQKKISAYKDISIHFTFRSEKKEKFIDEIKGSTLVKVDKYVLKTDQQQIYCDGATLWNYLPEQKEVTVSKYDKTDDSQMMNPLKMIQDYEKSYKSNFIKETTEKGVLIQIIDLTPLKPSSYYKVRLVIDKNKKQIMRATVYEKDGMQYIYTVSKFEVNKNLSDEQFVFDISKHSGVEVIDIR
jgi:outer membrane lipoprotein-sorting protein